PARVQGPHAHQRTAERFARFHASGSYRSRTATDVLARGGLRSPYVSGTGKAGAEGVRWDLTLLAPSERMMKERLEAALADAESFPGRWAGAAIAARGAG